MINNITEIWESRSDIIHIQEGSSEVDGIHILAKCSGPAFFPNSVSRNKVFYSIEAWESAISDTVFRQRLADRLVYGTIGHGADLDDNDIRDEKLSHIVTNVWIDEDGVGKAEFLVLNTGPGRVLNTLLRVGSKLRVSTRAAGYFEERLGANGVKTVIPTSFKLERIDYVVDPGYTEALPKLLESLNLDSNFLEKNLLHEGNTMTEKVVELLESRVKELKEEKKITESTATQLQSEIRTIAEAAARTNTILEGYQAFGTIAAVTESYAELSQYQSLGTVAEINEALEKGEETIDSLTGTIEDIKTQLNDQPEVSEDDDAGYQELGSPADVKDALEQALALTAELTQYRELGTVEELQQCLDSASRMTEEAEEAATQALVASLGVSREVVDGLLAKGLSQDEVIQLVGEIKGVAAPSESVPEDEETAPEEVVPEVEEVTPEVVVPTTDEEEEEKEVVGESMSSQLLRRTRRKQVVITENNKNTNTSKLSLAARLLTGRKA